MFFLEYFFNENIVCNKMKYWIDNKYYIEESNDNSVIIQKCFDVAEIDIPCFCYTESLSIAGIVVCVW